MGVFSTQREEAWMIQNTSMHNTVLNKSHCKRTANIIIHCYLRSTWRIHFAKTSAVCCRTEDEWMNHRKRLKIIGSAQKDPVIVRTLTHTSQNISHILVGTYHLIIPYLSLSFFFSPHNLLMHYRFNRFIKNSHFEIHFHSLWIQCSLFQLS